MADAFMASGSAPRVQSAGALTRLGGHPRLSRGCSLPCSYRHNWRAASTGSYSTDWRPTVVASPPSGSPDPRYEALRLFDAPRDETAVQRRFQRANSVTPPSHTGSMTTTARTVPPEKRNRPPGKFWRKGMTYAEFFQMIPDDAAAEAWIAKIRWPDGPECPHCGCDNVQHPTTHKTMPYRCRRDGCRRFFSVRVGTVMENSKLGHQVWVFAAYLFNTRLKSVSSMELHRDLGVTQTTAWHLAHRLRECWEDWNDEPFEGPVEVDESYFGDLGKNMHARKRARLTGRGAVDKTPVIGVKDRKTGRIRAAVIPRTNAPPMQGFVAEHVLWGAKVYSDDHSGYRGLPNHEAVKHSVSEYVKGQAHINGIESFGPG